MSNASMCVPAFMILGLCEGPRAQPLAVNPSAAPSEVGNPSSINPAARASDIRNPSSINPAALATCLPVRPTAEFGAILHDTVLHLRLVNDAPFASRNLGPWMTIFAKPAHPAG